MDDYIGSRASSLALSGLCGPGLSPFFWLPERRGVASAWWGHVPFAQWLVCAVRPRLLVELGTHNGVSYAAFCNAVLRGDLPTRCFAVDSWIGDPHAGILDESVFQDVREFHDARYGAFSTLLRCTFDEAVERFLDGSIDLLHIDGYHTYEAVRHDFETWLPKLSDTAVVLLHDIAVHHQDFGVWRFWQEIKEQYPHFEFQHCYGLGVLAVGKQIPDAVAELYAMLDTEPGVVLRNRIALLGDRWVDDLREQHLRQSMAGLSAAQAELATTRGELATVRGELATVRGELATVRGELAHAVRAKEEAEWARARSETELALKREALAMFLSSTTWRSTYPLRFIATKLPQPVRRRLRSAARFVWRASTLRRGLEPRQQHLSDRGSGISTAAAQRDRQRPEIVFVSGFPDTPSEAYRVLNPLSALEELARAQAIRANDIGFHAERLSQASIIVLFRVPWSSQLADIVKQARANGCVIVYDIDDYVFEPKIAKPDIIDGIRFLRQSDVEAYHQGVRAYREALQQADYCTVTTEFLAQRVRELGGMAYVLRNSVSPAMLLRYDQALRRRRQRQPDGLLRIGYAAGTLTHQRDFAQVTEVLAKVLRERDGVIMTVVGHLDIAEYPELAGLSHRIEVRPPVPHDDLPMELMRFDINIAPLEVGNPFCEAKSELKFFNAALVDVPTVASATEPFRAAIRHGQSGFLAANEAEWSDALFQLIDDARLRTRVGKRARSEALRQFGPGTMRLEVRRVFEELRHRRRPVTPPRHAGYDHFLYAINYPPASAHPGAPPTARTHGDRTADALDLQWLIPAFSVGWGGMTNVFRIIQQLERFGHRNTLWVHNPPSTLPSGATVSQHYRDMIIKHFPPIAAEVYPLPADLDQISGDAVIATDHFSAYPARAIAKVARRFYLLQDNEPAFSPAGYAGLFAEATYRFGFDALSNGEWLHALAQQYGMWSAKWEQAADPEHYFPAESERRLPAHVAFYARQETPRRAVELGYLAFELLAREGVTLHVDLFGGEHAPETLPCPFTHHGILSAAQLGDLYRRASVGMVFSATNYSIIPREMMACRLPVLELNSESSRASFPNGVAELADPTPESVAAHLKTLLLDRARREQLAQRALEFVANFSWEKSARDIENALLLRLGGNDEARGGREVAVRMGRQ